ncbi:MAG TPA: hypothetical protein VLJ80_15075 [Solirubrobacteraceae bacterium]|nr:hypothetical protein [Solirubrobacteraceae bacterium]
MTSDDLTTTRRIADFLVPRLDQVVEEHKHDGLDEIAANRRAVDSCSEILLEARGDVMGDFESTLTSGLSAETRAQKMMQASKSNAGKIFERFVAYAISRALAGSDWAVWKDTADVADVIGVSKKDLLDVTREAFGKRVEVLLEADFLIFQPSRPLETLVFVSTKSSMKDRLHNVTMWAVLLETLRDEAARKHLRLDASHLETLKRSRYVLVTGDFAEEQPDLRGGADPRALLQFDASFCDAAFAAVTPEWNSSLKTEVTSVRETAFYRLSALPGYLDALEVLIESGQAP